MILNIYLKRQNHKTTFIVNDISIIIIIKPKFDQYPHHYYHYYHNFCLIIMLIIISMTYMIVILFINIIIFSSHLSILLNATCFLGFFLIVASELGNPSTENHIF